jgi:hypothetical protein
VQVTPIGDLEDGYEGGGPDKVKMKCFFSRNIFCR